MRLPKSKTLYVSAAVVAMLGSSAAVAGAACKTVTVHDNGQRKVIRGVSYGSVGSFLAYHQVSMSAKDRAFPMRSAPVRSRMQVAVTSPAQVTLSVLGNREVVDTFASTVAQLVEQVGVDQLPGAVVVNHPLTQSVTNGEFIAVAQVRHVVHSTVRTLAFVTVQKPTSALYRGQTRVITGGVKGLEKFTVTDVIVNGRKVRQLFASTLLRHPVNQVVEVGTATRPYVLSGRSNGGSLVILDSLRVIATAYVGGGRTATGWLAQPGVIAVDPSVIPLGTKLYIPGIGVVRAEDTGGAIIGDRIDICMATLTEADDWGRRLITIYEIR